jgi:hypothetical protein
MRIVADRQDSDREVLTSLPRSRPVRRSAKRGERADAKDGASAPSRRPPAAKPRAAKAAATTAPRPAARRGARTPAGAGTTAQADVRTTSAAAEAKAGAAAGASERPRTAPQRKVPPAGYAAPTSRADESAAAGTADLLSTTIQAAGELAQIGLTVGRQTLQSMLDRLPKP